MKALIFPTIAVVCGFSLSAQFPQSPEISSAALVVGAESKPLSPIHGSWVPIPLRYGVNFDEAQSEVRASTGDVKMTFKIERYVKGSVKLVVLNTSKDKRNLKKSAGAKLDKKHEVEVTIKEIEPGTYEVTPKKALAPGEYGLYMEIKNGLQDTGGTLFDFGIDK
jgi:hypothetical protein